MELPWRSIWHGYAYILQVQRTPLEGARFRILHADGTLAGEVVSGLLRDHRYPSGDIEQELVVQRMDGSTVEDHAWRYPTGHWFANAAE
jgi:hypothetical protein